MVILIQQRLVDLAGAKFPLPYKQYNGIRYTTREVLPSTLPTTVIPLSPSCCFPPPLISIFPFSHSLIPSLLHVYICLTL